MVRLRDSPALGEMEAAKRCHLLELPAELRLRIYEHVYDEGYAFQVSLGLRRLYRWKRTDVAERQFQRSALLRTCRLISKEARPVLYAATFLLGLDVGPDADDYYGTNEDAIEGTLEGATYLEHVSKIDTLILDLTHWIGKGSMIDSAARLQQLIAILATECPPAISNLMIDLIPDFEKTEECIRETLDGLNCLKKDIDNIDSPWDGWRSESVSFEALERFCEAYSSVARRAPRSPRAAGTP